jgi:N-acetylglucosaminyl-diphospho-decaprenol L-rhamnosyltransferase
MPRLRPISQDFDGRLIYFVFVITGSAIVVTYNSAGQIGPCLEALRKSDRWQRIVVDNASRDDTIERAQEADPAACVVKNAKNSGFAAAANQGARLASGDILLFLNPDAIAQPDALDALANALEQGSVGAVGGALSRYCGEVDRGFCVRRFPTLPSMAAEILLLNHIWPSNPLNRNYRCLDLDYATLQDVDQPAGACLAVKREVWASVGGFDESFFPIWFEDVDLCLRIRAQNWNIRYCPSARFLHSGGHSVNRLPIGDRQIFWYRNLLRYWQKHESPAAVATLRVIIAVGMGLRSLAALFGAAPENTPRTAAIQAYARVVSECVLRARREGSDTQ